MAEKMTLLATDMTLLGKDTTLLEDDGALLPGDMRLFWQKICLFWRQHLNKVRRLDIYHSFVEDMTLLADYRAFLTADI